MVEIKKLTSAIGASNTSLCASGGAKPRSISDPQQVLPLATVALEAHALGAIPRDSEPGDWVCAGRCLMAFEPGEVESKRQV